MNGTQPDDPFLSRSRLIENEVILIENLTQYFMDRNPVLKDIDLSIMAGQLVLIVGPSGCGKSTLAYCIKGVIPHQMESLMRGRVEVGGLDTQHHPPAILATKVGMVFQDPEAQLCNLYIEDEVAFGPENLKLDPETVNSRVKWALNLVGLGAEDYKTKFVYELSGGEKQRLAVASVLAMDPTILIFDEPTANLDPHGAQEVFKTIKELHQQGYTILVVEHKIEELVDIADRMIVINDGRVVLDGAPQEILKEHGRSLKEDYGLWIPQASDIAIELHDQIDWNPFPLTTYDLAEQMRESLLAASTGNVKPSLEENGDSFQKGEKIIEVESLWFRYPDGTLAIEDISFSAHRGEVLGIAGTNGSGKTTLAKILVGLLKPTSGSANVCGMDIDRTPIHDVTRRVGYVFQYPEHQFLKENIYDEVAYSLEVHEFSPDVIQARTMEILRFFGLDKFKDRHPLTLSGGQKRRLSVATALVLEPDLLILDEPTFGQDMDNTRRMIEYLLQQITSHGDMTTVMITHDMELLAHYCNRALIMSGGKLIFFDAPRALFNNREILLKASLKDIPLHEFTSQMNQNGCKIPDFTTVDAFVRWYRRAKESSLSTSEKRKSAY